MVNKLKQIVHLATATAPERTERFSSIYRPEKPMTFVPRTDPNFYFYSKR